jgi:hypothetical protein
VSATSRGVWSVSCLGWSRTKVEKVVMNKGLSDARSDDPNNKILDGLNNTVVG